MTKEFLQLLTDATNGNGSTAGMAYRQLYLLLKETGHKVEIDIIEETAVTHDLRPRAGSPRIRLNIPVETLAAIKDPEEFKRVYAAGRQIGPGYGQTTVLGPRNHRRIVDALKQY